MASTTTNGKYVMERIGLLQVWQESNHFNPVTTPLASLQFSRTEAVTGEEIGGFTAGLNDWRSSVVPVNLLAAQAWPAGPLTTEARQWLVQTVIKQLREAGPFLDGILFSLHGALVAEDEHDMDGLLLERTRQFVGSEVPIVTTLDLHAHVTARMLRSANAFVAYHTNPHLDRFDTGRRAAGVLKRILLGAKPTVSVLRLPMIVPGEMMDTSSPALKPVFDRLRELEARPDVLSASILMVQPHLNVPDLGWAVMVTTDDASDLAHRLADELAEMCWRSRTALANNTQFYSAGTAVRKALECPGKPVVIADGADATNSGAPGDSVHLLREMMAAQISGGALTIMVDPQAVTHAQSVGEGGEFEFAVGGKRDHVFSQPLMVRGRVAFIKPARYVLSGHLGDALPVDMGRSAAVKVNDVTLLLVEKAGPGSSPMMYRCVGLEPKDFKIVVVKSPAGFRAEFEPFAAAVLLSACPGCAMPQLEKVPYTRISRPLWPLDEIADRRDVQWCRSLAQEDTPLCG